MDKINTKTFGLTLALLSTILSLICAIFYWLLPNLTISYFNYIVHGIDITQITTRTITLGNVLIGLVIVFISAYIVGVLFAMVYNYLNTKYGQGV